MLGDFHSPTRRTKKYQVFTVPRDRSIKFELLPNSLGNVLLNAFSASIHRMESTSKITGVTVNIRIALSAVGSTSVK